MGTWNRGKYLELKEKLWEYESKHPECPICKKRYRGDEYKIMMMEEAIPVKGLVLFIECPNGCEQQVRSIADGDYKRFLIVDGDTVRCGVG